MDETTLKEEVHQLRGEIRQIGRILDRLEGALDNLRDDGASTLTVVGDLMETMKRELPFLKMIKRDKELRERTAELEKGVAADVESWFDEAG